MIVVDANVVLSGLRSRRGASHLVLRRMVAGELSFAVSPAVVLEYEALLKRPGIFGANPWISGREVDQVLDAICGNAMPVSPWFRLRPLLKDANDDLYVECA